MENGRTHSSKRKHVCPCCGAKIPYHKFPLFQKDFVVECPHCEAELIPEKPGKTYFVIYILFSIVWFVGPQILCNSLQGSILLALSIYLSSVLVGHAIFFLFLAKTVDFVICKD